MIKKHKDFHKIPKKLNDNGTEKTKHSFQKDTAHECEAMGGKLTTFSMVMFDGVCPLCKERVLEIGD